MNNTIEEEKDYIIFKESADLKIVVPFFLLISVIAFITVLGGGLILKIYFLQQSIPVMFIFLPFFILFALTSESVSKLDISRGYIRHTKKALVVLKWSRNLKREDIKHITTVEEVREEMDAHHSAKITIRSKKNLSVPIIGAGYLITLFEVEEGDLVAGKEWIEWLQLLYETFQWNPDQRKD